MKLKKLWKNILSFPHQHLNKRINKNLIYQLKINLPTKPQL